MADSDKHLAFAVATWLQAGAGTNAKLQQASDLVSEAYGIDISDASQKSQYGSGPGLKNVWDVFMKTQAKLGVAAAAATAAESSAPAAGNTAASDEDKAKAETLKTEGNKAMSAKDYSAAIASYTQAIELHATNPVYFSNRSAAYAQVGQHEKAIEDAREASRVDPKFGKAYSRLGHALFSAGRYDEAVDAYQQGVEVDPTNALMKSGLETARQHAKSSGSSTNDNARSRDVSSPSNAGAGAGGQDPLAGLAGLGGGGGGGMPDLSSLMNNPMIAQMAQQMMSNGGLEQMMNNPMIQQMMSRFGGGGQGGGGMPDINAMMQDPQMREMARNMMGGMGGAGGGAGAGGRGGRGSGGNSNNSGGGSNAGDNMFS